MSVHYKFKSMRDFDTITFDGLHISVSDLKKAIVHQKKFGKTIDFDLQVTNAQTKEEYSEEAALIPKNTSLIIARIPLKNAPKKNWAPKDDSQQQQQQAQAQRKGHDSASAVQSNVDLSTMTGTEEDKIREMIFQSTAEYDPTNYQKIRGASQTGEVPINYKCFRCNKPGHWIKNCPMPLPKEAVEVKRTSGIPRSFIERDKDPENNPIMQPSQVPPEEKQVIPEDLICGICKDLFTDAVMIPCCGSSFCDECVRTALLESEDNECPDCKEKGSSPGSLIPNRFLRNSVNAFRNETGYTKAVQKASNKQTKPPEELSATPLDSTSSTLNITTVTTSSGAEVDGEEQPSESAVDDKHDTGDQLQESYEDVSQHGDIDSPPTDDKVFDNESDYEDNITVTVPPAHLQHRNAFRGHFNGRQALHRLETPPMGRDYAPQYSGANSATSGNRSAEQQGTTEETGSQTPKAEEKESSYNIAPAAGSKPDYETRPQEFHQPTAARGLMPMPPHAPHPPLQQPMGAHPPPHAGFMGQPHPGPAGPYPGPPPHGAPHPYPGGYGMQGGYPPQRPFEHHGGGMYHGERPRMMYPPRAGYPPHPPHMRPRHMAPMGAGGYPGVPNVGPGVIDDPLEAFNRIMREKERRKEQEAKQAANRHRSPHADRNRRSRSFDNSGSNRRGRSTERERRRSPRAGGGARSPDRRRTPDDKHGDERDRGDRERDRDRGDRERDRDRDRDRDRNGRRRNRSSSYSSSGSRSYSRSPATKRIKSPKRRSRSPYRERRSRSRSKSFEDRRHGKHKDRREERRDDHRGEYRDNRERSPGFNSHYQSSYRGRGGNYRGGQRGRGSSRDGGYQSHFPRGYDRGHPQGPPVQQPPPQHDQYGHPMGPGPNEYHQPHHHGVPPGVVPGSMPPHGVPPAGHYAPPPQQAMPPSAAVPSRYPPREPPRPYMAHPVKADSMGYYEQPPQPVAVQPTAPPVSSEPPPPGFEEQDTWSGKQETEYRAPVPVTPVKTAEENAYEYHNTPKSREHERAHTPIIHDDRHDHITRSHSKDKESKKKSREEIEEHHRREERRAKTPERHEKEKPSKRSDHGDKEKEREKKRNEAKRLIEKEREREREREKEKEKEREKEAKRKQRDSSEEDKKERKKEKEKKKRKKEKEAEKKRHKKERKEREKENRAKEKKKERKTVEKEEADSSQQPATPKHAPQGINSEDEKVLLHETRQPEVDTTQEYVGQDLDETLLVVPPDRSHILSKAASEEEEGSYREEPSSSHDQPHEQFRQPAEPSHDHSDLYSDIPEKYEEDQLEKSVLESHMREEEIDLVNSTDATVTEGHPEDIKRSDSILDLHANLDFEADLEEGEHLSPPPPKFIGIPELSKWELDEDTPVITSTERKPLSLEEHGISVKHEDLSSAAKVTNEVLKRAENAIFTRAIAAIRPIEIKKISVDRQKLYSNEVLLDDEKATLDIKMENQQDELKRFQVTVPTNDDNAERSVEIKPEMFKPEGGRASPVRASIKERLGSKITEIRGSSSSGYSRSRTPPPVRKVKASSSSSSAAALTKVEQSSRKRTRSRSAERDDGSGSRKPRSEREERHRDEIRIRRQDTGRRVVVAVREPTPEKRREHERKDRGERRSKDRMTKDVAEKGREKMMRRSQEKSREKRRERSTSPIRRERERERERERDRGRDKDRRREHKEDDERHRKIEGHLEKTSSSHSHKEDRKAHSDRKRTENEPDRHRHRNLVPLDKDRRDEGLVRREDSRKRIPEEFPEKSMDIPAKKPKAEKAPKRDVASSSDSSSSGSESSSTESSSESDEETVKKRKKRKHKKERKRSKRSGSTESDESSSKKKKKSKKSKSSKKKKKDRKHRKE